MYRPLTGGANLTDIRPIARTVLLTKLFGPVGLGWKLDYDSDDVVVHTLPIEVLNDKKLDRTKVAKTAGFCVIKKVSLYVRWIIDGELTWGDAIPCPGINQNPMFEYTGKGALTTGFGGAISQLLFQASVYAGVLNHKNATIVYEKVGKHPFERELLTGYSQAKDLSIDRVPATTPTVEEKEAEETTPEAPKEALPEIPAKEDETHWSDKPERIGPAMEWAMREGETFGNLPSLRAILEVLGKSAPEEAEDDVLKVLIHAECAKITQEDFLAKVLAYVKPVDAPF